MTRILTIASQKGGAGKTTLAASLSVAAAQGGERVVALDLDPQGSLWSWKTLRAAADPAVDRVQLWELSQLPEILAALVPRGVTLAVLDAGGQAAHASIAALRAADLVLVPARPSRLDLLATRPTIEALARLGMGDRLALVLNQCPSQHGARTLAFAERLKRLGVLAEPTVNLRVDHQDALGLGLGVTEHAPGGKAADEIRRLWAWIRGRLGPAPA
ncbi:nucleotide-binding protein [Methylobacterium planeticum]|uniref:AAA family ATPase n=1 Tax=Methylobacterium planeticum TaxID=2615211 RepID=A0A6N6MXU6_9HYPH|nr:AAA family ATPase [Methylobacterium planeticum]KAB1075749.1 AAA family ATPase [Methylobacterium planeticum]